MKETLLKTGISAMKESMPSYQNSGNFPACELVVYPMILRESSDGCPQMDEHSHGASPF